MKIKVKYITREGWKRIFGSVSAYTEFETPSLCGTAGLLRLDSVREPLTVHFKGESMTIVDNGYFWLQIAPQGQNWWLTVMYDADGRCLQYYFDITKENIVDGERSYFYDMFLDLVAVPDGRLIILDEDELEDALSEKVITEAEYRISWGTLNALADGIPKNAQRLESFCQELFEKLKQNLKN